MQHAILCLITWHFITATLSVSRRCTEHFLVLVGACCPKATPLLKAVKNKRHQTKAKSFILADKLKSSSDIAPIAEQVKCIRQLWLKNFFRWIQRLSQQPRSQTTSSVFTGLMSAFEDLEATSHLSEERLVYTKRLSVFQNKTNSVLSVLCSNIAMLPFWPGGECRQDTAPDSLIQGALEQLHLAEKCKGKKLIERLQPDFRQRAVKDGVLCRV